MIKFVNMIIIMLILNCYKNKHLIVDANQYSLYLKYQYPNE